MAQLKSKVEMDAAIVSVFKINKDAQKLHTTPDGQCFLEGSKSFAELHARRNKMSVRTVERSDYEIPFSEEAVKEVLEIKEVKNDAEKAEELRDYDLMTIPALKSELINREIVFTGKEKKPALIELLNAADLIKK